MRTRVVTVLATIVMALFGMGAVPAQAAVSYYPTLRFDKDYERPWNSKLTFRVWRTDRDTPVVTKEYRAGAGSRAAGIAGGATNECKKKVGWLPNGTYPAKLHLNYPGTEVKGIAIELENKRCKNGTGTERTALFIHTQKPWPNGDVGYGSKGCIKLSPTDIEDLARTWQNYHLSAGKRYAETLFVA